MKIALFVLLTIVVAYAAFLKMENEDLKAMASANEEEMRARIEKSVSEQAEAFRAGLERAAKGQAEN